MERTAILGHRSQNTPPTHTPPGGAERASAVTAVATATIPDSRSWFNPTRLLWGPSTTDQVVTAQTESGFAASAARATLEYLGFRPNHLVPALECLDQILPQTRSTPQRSAATAGTPENGRATPNLLQTAMGVLFNLQHPDRAKGIGLAYVLNFFLSNLDRHESLISIPDSEKDRFRAALRASLLSIGEITISDGTSAKTFHEVASEISTRLEDFQPLLCGFIAIPIPRNEPTGPSVQAILEEMESKRRAPPPVPLTKEKLHELIHTTLPKELAQKASVHAVYQAASYFIGSGCPDIHKLVTTSGRPTGEEISNLDLLKEKISEFLEKDTQLNPIRKFFIRYIAIPFVSYFAPYFIEKIASNITGYISEIIKTRKEDREKAFDPTLFNKGRDGTQAIIDAFVAFSERKPLTDEKGKQVCPSSPYQYVAMYLKSSFDYSKWIQSLAYRFIPQISLSEPFDLAISHTYKWFMHPSTTGAKIFLSLMGVPVILGLTLFQWIIIYPVTIPINFLIRLITSSAINQTEFVKNLQNKDFSPKNIRWFGTLIDSLIAKLYEIININITSNPQTTSEESTSAAATELKELKTTFEDVSAASRGFIKTLLKAAKLASKNDIDQVKAALSPPTPHSELAASAKDGLELGKEIADGYLIEGSVDIIMSLISEAFKGETPEQHFYTILQEISKLLTIQSTSPETLQSTPEGLTATQTVDDHQTILVSRIVNDAIDGIKEDAGRSQKMVATRYVEFVRDLFGTPATTPIDAPATSRSPSTREMSSAAGIGGGFRSVSASPEATAAAALAPGAAEPRPHRIDAWEAQLRALLNHVRPGELITTATLRDFLQLDQDFQKLFLEWKAQSTLLTSKRTGTNITNKRDLKLLSQKLAQFNEQMISLKKDLLLVYFPTEPTIERGGVEIVTKDESSRDVREIIATRGAITNIISAYQDLARICTSLPLPQTQSTAYESAINELKRQFATQKRILVKSLKALQEYSSKGYLENNGSLIKTDLEANIKIIESILTELDQLVLAQKEIHFSQTMNSAAIQLITTNLSAPLTRISETLTELARTSTQKLAMIDTERAAVTSQRIQDTIESCLDILSGEQDEDEDETLPNLRVLAAAIKPIAYVEVNPTQTDLVTGMLKATFNWIVSNELAQIRHTIKQPALIASIVEPMFLEPMIE